MSSVFSRLGGGLGSTTVLNFAGLLAGVGSGAILARSLGPLGRGEFAAAVLWPNIFILFGDLGLGFAFSYAIARNRARAGELFTAALLAGAGIGTLAALIGFAVLSMGGSIGPEVRSALRLTAWTVPLILTSGHLGYLLLGANHVAEYNAIRFCNSLLNLGTVAVVALAGASSTTAYALAYTATQGTVCILALYFCVARFRPALAFSRALVPELLSYGLRTHLSSLAAQANLRLDQAVMSLLVSPDRLGLYVVAVSISGILSPFLNAVAVVVLPRTAHAATAAGGAMASAGQIRSAVELTLPILLAAIVCMPWVLPAFFGARFVPAVRCAQILVVAGLLQGINAILGNALRGLGRPGAPAVAEAGGMVVTAALLWLLLPPLGILGAALTSLLAYAVVAFLQFRSLAQTCGVDVWTLAAAEPAYPVRAALAGARNYIRGQWPRNQLSL